MRTALDASEANLDSDEQTFVAKVREHGWFRMSVAGDSEGPGFSYTTGFWVSARQPEVILFGLKSETAHDVFWDLFRDAEGNKSLVPGRATQEVFGNQPAYVFPVAKRFYAEYLGWSRWFYGSDDFPCFQIVWPDRNGVFPWQPGFDPQFFGSQPDLSEMGWQAILADGLR